MSICSKIDKENINKIVKIFNAQWVKINGQKYLVGVDKATGESKSVKTEAEIVKESGRY